MQQILFSNGVTTDFDYDIRGRLQNIHAYTTTDLLNLTYSYDFTGNITYIENDFLTASQEWINSSEIYTYDDLDRLISASNGFGALSYTYDSKKRLSVTENGQTIPYTYDYDLLLSAGQHTFTYDSNGNTLSKSSESQWVYYYDNANRLTQVNRNGQVFGQYIYDGDNRRIKNTEWSEDLQDFVTTTYIYSGSNILYEETMSGTALYVYGPSGKVAKKTIINNETNTFYYTTDYLGSTRLVTNENGTPSTSVKYYPFGETNEYSGSTESYLFTGTEKDETGLYYFGARYYNPNTGRFITRDPYTFLPDDPRFVGSAPGNCSKWLTDPQRFERFSYARNNPLRYRDPWGERICENVGSGDCDDLPEAEEAVVGEDSGDDPDCDEECQRKKAQDKCIKDCMKVPRVVDIILELDRIESFATWWSVGWVLTCAAAGLILGPWGVAAATVLCVAAALYEIHEYNRYKGELMTELEDLGCLCALGA